jgi:hypothetical protein
LASWDSPPTEAEMEEIKPLLARIQELKSGRGGALLGTQLVIVVKQHMPWDGLNGGRTRCWRIRERGAS